MREYKYKRRGSKEYVSGRVGIYGAYTTEGWKFILQRVGSYTTEGWKFI